MVHDLLIWSFQVSLLIALMYGSYWLLFKKNTHFQLRRLTILACLLLAVSIPFIEIEVLLPWSNPIVDQGLDAITFEPTIPTDMTVAVSPQEDISSVPVSNTISWQKILLNVYLVGLITAAALFVFEILKLSYWYYLGARRTDIQDNVITHKGIKYPFSFWKWIFIPQGTDYDKHTWEIIEKHESAHLNQYHTLDMVIVNFFQCFFWYNPIIYLIQKELKDNHEALADQSVLSTTEFKVYAKALVSVSINSSALSLGHSFALVSTLSKRITAMQTKRTAMTKTILNIFLLTLTVGVSTATHVLKAQDKVETREEAFETIKNRSSENFSMVSFGKLTEKHQRILQKLRESYPEKEIHSRYYSDTRLFEFKDFNLSGTKSLYYAKLTKEDKSEVMDLIESDTARLYSVRYMSNIKSKFKFSLTDFMEEVKNSVDKHTNYIVFYEYLGRLKDEIYDISEVEVKPQPIGGVETFVRAIALDVELPNEINKKDLPPSIDFEVVVNGGKLLTNIKLLTELKGSDRKNKDMYLFFGQVHNMMLKKVRELYSWKRGIKDGKEVRVRTIIAIPTKYMM